MNVVLLDTTVVALGSRLGGISTAVASLRPDGW